VHLYDVPKYKLMMMMMMMMMMMKTMIMIIQLLIDTFASHYWYNHFLYVPLQDQEFLIPSLRRG